MSLPLDAHVSVFRGSRNTTPVETVPLSAILQRIQDGTYEPYVTYLRALLTTEGKAPYDTAKRQSMGFTPAGVFAGRANAKLTTASGLLNFDFDHLPALTEAKARLSADSFVVYTFVSPSADGLKVGVWADGIVDDTTYKHAWGTVLEYFERTYPDLAVANDKACKDIARLCYTSHDPDAYSNPDARLYIVPPYQAPAPEPKSPPRLTGEPLPADRRERYARQAVGTAVQMLDASIAPSPTSPGTRHATRLKAARLLGGYVAGGILTYADAFAALHNAVARNTDDLTRSMKTVEDGLGHGQAQPITLEQLEAERLDWLETHRASQAAQHRPAVPDMSGSTPGPQDAPAPDAEAAWTRYLLLNQKDVPTENLSNLLLILEHHPDWRAHFWWDTVRTRPMRGDLPIDETLLSDIALWFGTTMRMSIRSLRLLETAVRRVCQYHAHDLLQEWLEAIPAWDGVERLTEWLADVASITKDAYGMEISRLIPVSMVARALEPGCQYRTVVILEGPEDSGKSKLVQTLASMEWYVDFDVSMESKEAHMLLQGAWVAELAELATLSRTEEAKLKSFLTLQEDVWIPKYSNFPQRTPRRTIFIGTVNPEEEYLKGQTGNTRFLPIQTGEIDCALLEEMREQLFAEALVYYRKHPDDWWQLSKEGTQQAVSQRESRRQASIYEADLADWLKYRRFNQEPTFITGETSWPEIAQHYLQIDREKWKDKPLQMQIAQALRALGYVRKKRMFDVIWEKPQAQ